VNRYGCLNRPVSAQSIDERNPSRWHHGIPIRTDLNERGNGRFQTFSLSPSMVSGKRLYWSRPKYLISITTVGTYIFNLSVLHPNGILIYVINYCFPLSSCDESQWGILQRAAMPRIDRRLIDRRLGYYPFETGKSNNFI